MSFDPITAAVDLGKMAIERIWPDPAKRAEELRKLQELEQKGDLATLNAHVQLMLAQVEVNKVEAQNKSLFVAGWRPWIGWVGGISLSWQFIAYPMLMWVWALGQARGYIPNELDFPPVLDSGPLFSIVTAMLGVGAMRSYDKKQGTQTDTIGG